MFFYFSYAVSHENFVFSFVIWPVMKIFTFWLLGAFLIFSVRFADIFAVFNSRQGIVRFFFTNLLLLVLKPWLILFDWYIAAYATLHKKMYVFICHGFSDTNWPWCLYFDVQNFDPFHPLILYFLRNLVVPRYSQITNVSE